MEQGWKGQASSNSEAVGQPCKGFSLVEAAIVLGVIGFVLGGIWWASASVYEKKAIKDGIADMLIVHSNTRSLFKGFDMSTANQRLDGILAKNAGIWRGTTTFRVYDVGMWSGYAYTPWAKLINFRLQNNTFVWDIVMKSTSDCVDFGTRIRAVLIQAREVGIVTAVGGSAYGPSPTVAQCQTVYNGYINHFVIQVSF